MITFKTYRAWEIACSGRGWKGPFTISGQNQSQFVGENGTAAIWNYDSGQGFIFGDDPPALETPPAAPSSGDVRPV